MSTTSRSPCTPYYGNATSNSASNHTAVTPLLTFHGAPSWWRRHGDRRRGDVVSMLEPPCITTTAKAGLLLTPKHLRDYRLDVKAFLGNYPRRIRAIIVKAPAPARAIRIATLKFN